VTQGDRVGALQFANVHAALVRQHLETEPDAEVEEWIARLHSGELPAPTAAAAVPRSRAEPGAAEDAAARELDEIARVLSERFDIGERAGRSTLLLSFEARDRRDTRPVELHVLRPRLAALGNRAGVVDALERVAALHDPRIVPVRDFGVIQGLVYFTTPPVEGPSLRDRLTRERQLPVDDARAIAGELVEALAYAHGRDVRHGDLRPKHILLGRSGIAVTGFGLVEALDLAAGGSAGSTAVTIGAPAYLSPEQLTGETSADERSDLYSLGCILFEMLAGEAPFAGTNMAAVLSRKLTQPAPRVRSLRESVPPALEAFVERCLARLPADRFQRATEAREALPTTR
jgi:serine/threonine-protein kinase